ncbi:hypothetical protein [Microbacterium sp. A93]|uniref:hypothetical protein n=1 Tax=Microbacterium sp. A93 TaxID=3450716 RepID=UPI003F42DFDD
MSENPRKGPMPRLGTPQIKGSAPRPADQPTEAPLSTRRSPGHPRRVDSAAGAPAGNASQPAILELPAATISPSDVRSLTGQLPTDLSSTRRDADLGGASRSGSSPAMAVRVDHDGVAVWPDGHPLTRRELREWRRRQEEASAWHPEPSEAPAPSAAAGPPSQSRRAEAPVGSPGTAATAATAAEGPTRESLATEGAALAARIEESGGGDPSAVDPVLLREQELLAERARLLNTGLIARVPVADPAPAAPTAPLTSEPAATVTPMQGAAAPVAAQEPVQARSAHGLDSLGASAWSSREHRLILAAILVILALLVALILALVL